MRGAFAGSISAAVSVAAHAAGNGMAPTESSVVLLVLGCAAVGAVSATPRADRHATWFLAASLALGQAIGHITLSVGAVHHDGLQLSPAMMAAHAVAIAVAAVLILAGERGCALAVSALTRALPLPFAPLPVVASTAVGIPTCRPTLARWLLVGSSIGTRGPPHPV